jgi:predicted nucleic acid-binding protein
MGRAGVTPSVLLIDTDIMIDAARGVTRARDFLADSEETATLAISAVTYLELLVGCRNKVEVGKLDRSVEGFRQIPIEAVTSDMAVALMRRYRLSHGLLIADALIAATAIGNDLRLVTKNKSDYSFISGLKLTPYV